MNTIGTTLRTRTAALRMPRLLTVLALAIALVAIPAFNPIDADARYRWEGQARAACQQAGGHVKYQFVGSGYDNYWMECLLPAGADAGFSFCSSVYGGGGHIVDCF